MKIVKALSLVILLVLLIGAIYNLYPEDNLPSGIKIDSLSVFKSKREMLAFSNGKCVKIFKISLSKNSVGHKEFEGDKKTPEGIYYINDKNPNSSYHKNLGVSYPNQTDIDCAEKLGKSPGGDIKIHGIRNYMGIIGKFHRLSDWTLGCIAVTNSEIDELFDAVDIGTLIDIYP
ncbi:MAG: L,D-transpeptidase family protein [Bacteroidetes bacterium]|nr:L,D-transpeptidase family protein [Bacteroidota bacterium]